MSEDPKTKDEASTGRTKLPELKMPSQGLPTGLWVAIFAVLAIILFYVLESRRSAPTDVAFSQSRQPGSFIASPPELQLRDEARFAPSPLLATSRPAATQSGTATRQDAPPTPVYSSPNTPTVPVEPNYGAVRSDQPVAPVYYPSGNESPSAAVAAATPTRQNRRPALVFDGGVRRLGPQSTETQAAGRGRDQGEQALRPEPGRTAASILPSGTLIPAILQTSLDSSKGGPAKALVTSDTKGFGGRKILVPKGSRLLGEFAGNGAAQGKRIAIVWNRLILPDGRQVRIDFPATDKQGAPGVEGKVRTNSLGRFAGGILQTVLNVATFQAFTRASSDTVVVGSPTGGTPELFDTTARRRITVPAGTKVSVFVAQDIDFE